MFFLGKEFRIGGNFRVIVVFFVMYMILFYECLWNNDNYFFIFGFLRDMDIDKGLIEEEDENEEDLFYRYFVFYFLILIVFLYIVVILINWCGFVINWFLLSDKFIFIEL